MAFPVRMCETKIIFSSRQQMLNRSNIVAGFLVWPSSGALLAGPAATAKRIDMSTNSFTPRLVQAVASPQKLGLEQLL